MTAVQLAPNARQVTGRVVSDRMNKTVTVLVERRVKHPVYGKYIRRSSRFHAHDADNDCRTGDLVTIAETRPLSRSKSWALLRIDERAVAADDAGMAAAAAKASAKRASKAARSKAASVATPPKKAGKS